MKAASNVPHASLVTIEPNTEDDWEILELNSDLAEGLILNQVCYLFYSIKHSTVNQAMCVAE